MVDMTMAGPAPTATATATTAAMTVMMAVTPAAAAAPPMAMTAAAAAAVFPAGHSRNDHDDSHGDHRQGDPRQDHPAPLRNELVILHGQHVALNGMTSGAKRNFHLLLGAHTLAHKEADIVLAPLQLQAMVRAHTQYRVKYVRYEVIIPAIEGGARRGVRRGRGACSCEKTLVYERRVMAASPSPCPPCLPAQLPLCFSAPQA